MLCNVNKIGYSVHCTVYHRQLARANCYSDLAKSSTPHQVSAL